MVPLPRHRDNVKINFFDVITKKNFRRKPVEILLESKSLFYKSFLKFPEHAFSCIIRLIDLKTKDLGGRVGSYPPLVFSAILEPASVRVKKRVFSIIR